jgi:hypothetical protein
MKTSRRFVGEVERDEERKFKQSARDDEVERKQRRASESTQDGRKETELDRFDSSASGNFYTSILNFPGDRVKDKQRRAKVQTDQGKTRIGAK